MDKISMSPSIRINDKATKQIEKVNSTLNKLNKVAATPTVRINDKANSQLEKINGSLNRLVKAKIAIRTNIIDRISGPTRTILSGLGRIKNTAWSATVTIKDKASSGLSIIRNGLSRTIGMAASLQGLLLGVGGAWAGFVKPMQISGDFEQTQIAFNTMLHSAQKANDFLSQAQDMANNTPFEFPQLANASKKLLAFGWDVKSILPDLTTIGNTASGLGLGAKGIDEITLALGQMKAKGRVQGDEILQLTEAGVPATKILQEQLGLTANQVANIGNQGLAADKAIKALLTGMDQRFGGMMQAQSKTALGLMSTLKDTFENKILNQWGTGLWSGIKPGLSKVTDWLDKNDKKVTELGSLFRKAGENVSSFIGGGLEKAQQRLSKLMDSSQWKNATLGGKITLAWDKVIAEPFDSWWNGPGKPKINKVAGDIGSAIGGTIGGGIVSFLDALGGKDNKVGGAGTSAGTAFTSAFLKAFDTGKIVDKLISSFKNANLNAAKDPNASTLTKAGLMDYILLGTLGGAKAVKGGAKAAKWFFGKGEGASKAASAGKGTMDAAEEVAKGASNTSRATRFFTIAGNMTKRVPLFGTVASLAGAGATVAMSSNKKRSVADVTGGLVGGVTGAKAGATIGGTIGSIFGPAGTAVGAGVGSVAGGIAGSIGGEKALDWIYTKTGPAMQYLKTGFGDAKKSVQTSWNGLGKWFNTNVSTPVSSGLNNAEKSIENKWSNTKTWFSNKVGIPFKNGAVTAVNVGVGAFSIGKEKAQKAWSPYGNWLNTNVFQPVKNKASNTGQWIGNKIGQGKSQAQSHWSGFTNWWSTNISVPTQNAASRAGLWIGTKLGQGKSWAQSHWSGFTSWWSTNISVPTQNAASSAGQWIGTKLGEGKSWAQNTWSSFSGWWSSNVSSPVENATSTVGSWIAQKFSEAKSSVQGVWSDFSSWWSTNISGPFNSFVQTAENKGQQITGWKIPKKANGGFTTGPELSVIGEAGTEAVIPLSSSRRNRGLQLWQQAGRMLGVGMFADGGIVGSGTSSGGNQKTTASLNTTISLGDDSLNSFKQYGKKINDYLGNGIITEKKVPDDSMNKVTDSSKGILDLFSKNGHIYGIGIDNDIAAGINSATGNVTSVVKILTDKVIEQFKTGFGIHSPSRVFYKLSQFIPQGVIKGMSSVDVKSFINKWMSDIISSAGAVGGNVSGWISAALSITGSPMSWLPKLLDITSRESGDPGKLGTGNPSLMNSGPGSASGLMQCMPSTFAEFALPGLGDIFNPIANAVAAIRYIKSRYGSPENIYTGPGYQGYATGTDNARKGLARINERGWEFVDFTGGEKVLTHMKSVNLMERAANSIRNVKTAVSSLVGTTAESKSANPNPIYYTSQPQMAMAGASYGSINVKVDNKFSNDVNIEDIVRQATAKFATELRKTLQNTKR
ncbi:hypothetical protein D9O40_00710 [Clostridium autoethanogenum]|uniref:Uncharacterized protein n=2 Tax=Clostridium autoethanogenum TaxID=84023 RepID=A0A3M0T503_9CLOT|nr:hypothetical protein D9O40_00710 [Clostridium autoethanogenum]